MAQTNMQKLIAALTGPANDLEAALQALLTERAVDTAFGVQLDQLGDIVGQPRNGATDDDYRRYLRARIATNRSHGIFEDLIRVSVLVLNDPTNVVDVQTYQIATAVVSVLAATVTTAVADILISFLLQAKEAGVRIILIYSNFPPSTTFTYDGTSAQAYDNGHYAGALD